MPKIQLHPNLAKLKASLETGHNLVDHFLVCGIPPSSCVNDILYETKNPKYSEIFKENFKPSIISKFPEFDNSIDTIDDSIVNYCFPEGFKPIFSKKIYLEAETKFFTVILDNNLFSIEHPQKYLSCLLFYENINSYKNLKEKIEREKDILDVEEVEEIYKDNDNNNIFDEEEKIKNNKSKIKSSKFIQKSFFLNNEKKLNSSLLDKNKDNDSQKNNSNKNNNDY